MSYLTHDGVRDWNEDERLYGDLTSNWPPHASPLEHVATPDPANRATVEVLADDGETVNFTVPILGNFTGWRQLRHQAVKF